MKFRILGDNSQLWQWDTGQKLIVEDDGTCNEVHFCNNRSGETALVLPIMEKDGLRLVDIPNILLQKANPLTAFLYHYDAEGSETRYSYNFPVRARPKPESYVYTETEVLNYAYLDERLKDLEAEGLANAVADYLKENPIEAGATAEEAEQIQQNKADIEQLTKEKLDADKLPEAVNDALAQAKASGEFKGEPGYTPVKGVDYFDGEPGDDYILTDADKTEIAKLAAEMVEVPEGGSSDAVQYVEQALTEEQQMQARKNLGLYGSREEFVTLGQIYTVFGGGTVDLSGYVIHAGLVLDTTKPLVMELFDPHTNVTVHSATYYPQGEDYFDPNQYTDCNYWYWGNHSLLQNDATAWQYLSPYRDKNGYDDAPFVICSLFDEYLGWYRKLILSPDLAFPGPGGYTVILRSNDKETVYDKIPEEYLPDSFNEPGADGGYYTPSVVQTDANTMKVSYIASKGDMPSVADQSITLPKGEPGIPGEDGTTPHIGDNGNWWIGDADTGVSAAGSGGSAGGSDYTLVANLTTEEEVDELLFNTDVNGQPFAFSEMWAICNVTPTAAADGSTTTDGDFYVIPNAYWQVGTTLGRSKLNSGWAHTFICHMQFREGLFWGVDHASSTGTSYFAPPGVQQNISKDTYLKSIRFVMQKQRIKPGSQFLIFGK